MKINFVGDLIFGDQPVKFGYGFDSQHSSQAYASVFDGVRQAFGTADFTVANFEAVIKPRMARTHVSNWSMCCDQSVAPVLADAGVSVVSVANNHTMDYSVGDYQYTIAQVQAAGIRIIGQKECPYTVLSQDGERVAVIGVSYIQVAHTPAYFCNPTDEQWQAVMEQLEAQQVAKRIVYVHWGSEFIFHPTQRQLEIARSLTRLPIDAVVGHHPHILQAKGLVQAKPVVFSLGNFVSDYWQERARKTEILRLTTDLQLSDHYETIACKIDENGIPHVVEEALSLQLSEYDDTVSDNREVAAQRSVLRKEYMCEFLRHFYKIKGKLQFARWVISRLLFIVKYHRLEKTRPEIIYEKYQH